jgi:hypothetical protein
VQDIRKYKKSLTLQSNGGTLKLNKVAMFEELGCEVWFSSRAITNILSLAAIQQQYQVTYDSGVETNFVVHQSKHGLSDMIFRMHCSGLHYYDPSEEGFTFIETVDNNKLAFTKRQLQGAERAKVLYAGLGFPSVKDFVGEPTSIQLPFQAHLK